MSPRGLSPPLLLLLLLLGCIFYCCAQEIKVRASQSLNVPSAQLDCRRARVASPLNSADSTDTQSHSTLYHNASPSVRNEHLTISFQSEMESVAVPNFCL
jgi:hypothetical protein